MWELTNRTPFAADSAFARDDDGAEVLLSVVKATFTIAPDGTTGIAAEQVPVHRTPRHTGGDPARSSLLYDSDFVLRKRATDVLLAGHAQAPGRPVAIMEVGLRVGSWKKRAVVFGDRRWRRTLRRWRLTDPEPFTRIPLVYERAFGGRAASGDVYEANPVGVGYAPPAEAGAPAPNLEAPEELLTSPSATPRPMGFGPIARHWPLRRRLAGTYDERWRRERRPLVPEDFDDAFYQSAPADQRLALEGGEEVELTGVHPRGTLHFELPRLSLSFRSRLAGELVEHPASLHSVLFEPDRDRVILVAASALPCHRHLHALERTVIEEASAT